MDFHVTKSSNSLASHHRLVGVLLRLLTSCFLMLYLHCPIMIGGLAGVEAVARRMQDRAAVYVYHLKIQKLGE